MRREKGEVLYEGGESCLLSLTPKRSGEAGHQEGDDLLRERCRDRDLEAARQTVPEGGRMQKAIG